MSKELTVNSAYLIVSGIFRFDHSKIGGDVFQHFANWKARINNGDYASTFHHFNSSYYDNYLKNIFPEINFETAISEKLNPDFLNHLTLKKCFEKPVSPVQLPVGKETSIDFSIPYIDVYLFPHHIGIFSIKADFLPGDGITLQKISDFSNRIRNLYSKMSFGGEELTLKSFIDTTVLQPFRLDGDWSKLNPQLKTYIMVDLGESIDDKEMDYLLYDLGNVSPLGSAKGEGAMAPSELHLKKQIEENKISAFRNWSALALFDTFTRVSINYPDTFKTWEHEFFNIYIHCLYVKFYMYLANTELSNLTKVTNKTEQIRDNFVEFMNQNYLSHISYRWLANSLHEKIMSALDIKGEMEKMDAKITRINEYTKEGRSKRLNRLLLAVAVIGAVSVLLNKWSLREIGGYLGEVWKFITGLAN